MRRERNTEAISHQRPFLISGEGLAWKSGKMPLPCWVQFSGLRAKAGHGVPALSD